MDKTANMLGALALVMADATRGAMNEAVGVSGETVAAIVTLGANPGLQIGDLATALGLTHSGGVRLVDRLCAEDLVERFPSADPRAVLLRLSRSGARTRRKVLEVRAQVLETFLKPLSALERTTLDGLLSKMLAAQTTDISQGFRTCRLCDEGSCVPFGCPVEQRCQPAAP
jgi:DNA-binding MarR family transcriptional regulator